MTKTSFRPLEELFSPAEFVPRHIGPSLSDRQHMLETIGMSSLRELIDQTVPTSIRSTEPLNLPGPVSEAEVLDRLRVLADKNSVFTSCLGAGWHDTFTPSVIVRNVLENPGWYTAYTPYQPEISQGRLEVLLAFQSMVADLAGMEIANASLLDESTAGAEAMALLHRAGRGKGDTFFIDEQCHPQTVDVLRTRATPLGLDILVGDPWNDPITDGCFGVLVQYPGGDGQLRDLSPVVERFHKNGAGVAVAADLLALCLITPPGELGVDVVVGSAQRFGVPMGFGGPHAGFMAVNQKHQRMLPGRLVGTSVDVNGQPAQRLALQTREQHIRRERATSNICTAQVLLAIVAALYAAYHGPEGLKRIAQRVHRLTAVTVAGLAQHGFRSTAESFFDTATIHAPGQAEQIVEAARQGQVNLRLVDQDHVAFSLDETTSSEVVETIWEAFGLSGLSVVEIDASTSDGIPSSLQRTSDFCQAACFLAHQSETEMLRWLRRLSDRDLALDRTMIPLGSCTMKLNATTEMMPITWPEFSGLHPYAPAEQVAGYHELIADLEQMLVEITGYAAVSLQPNAGSQGELAGLLAIQAWHHQQGHPERTICLIPASAHGTNAASAVMAGLKVVVVECDDQGNVDLKHLDELATLHAKELSTFMITYPSTHGVFEPEITQICARVHDAGGQVYLDGANLNAMVGLARPGRFGADVSHLNLHKTFCIPHGGGGPGVGPIGVGAHLAPFLPNHPVVKEAGPATGVGAISAAPWGSAGVLPITWAYITLMGGTGLTEASEIAILSANYIAARLSDDFPVLYRGENSLVAHECILDTRWVKEAGVSADDLCKRLIDYGFHAPTVSFPVVGTLMVEPTESESLATLDSFCDAMVAIAQEVRQVTQGDWPAENNPLVNAPHTAQDLAGSWDRPYSRELAAYPLSYLQKDKYWPPVGRIDAAYGDKNLVCACPSLDDYRETS
ncbi:MAG TPA: glycine dehydrogenase (aminomethyl-transferring) [Acidimicrobiia bacterium]|jgi:glycine dehydrogenase|nr:aminomethyl-transferring glycine dehydrogenase [Acidimicrobiia bacterium]HIL45645.1 glycine dehydrogenase (aminomethyl-transferring) [Acidimicrobiia bacterium]